MNGYYSTQPRFWRGLSLAIGLTGVLLWPTAASAQDTVRDRERQENARQADSRQANNEPTEQTSQRPDRQSEQPLAWARVDYILNRVQFVPRRAKVRKAVISDVLGVGDALRTFASASAELRFNDGSEARIGEEALFRFTPNTRNFELSNGTILLLIPPGRGRTTIQTPNAVTGIQGSALFVRYIEETDTTIVGALTDNPDGPMTLITEDGSQRQALYANQVGVVEGDRITQIYELDGQEFWETSGLAESFDYKEDVGPATDQLDGVRQEIRAAIEGQDNFDDSNAVENPPNFSRPETEAQAVEPTEETAEEPVVPAEDNSDEEGSNQSGGDVTEKDPALTIETEEAEEQEIQYEGSPAEEFHNQNNKPAPVENDEPQTPPSAALTEAEDEDEEAASAEDSDRPSNNAGQSDADSSTASDRPTTRPSTSDRPANGNPPATINATDTEDTLIDDTALPAVPDSETTEILAPPTVTGSGRNPNPPAPIAQPNAPTGGVTPLPPAALTDGEASEESEDEDESVVEETDGGTDDSLTGDSDGGSDNSEDEQVVETGDGDSTDNIDSETEGSEDGPVVDETDATLNNTDGADVEASEDEAVEVEVPETEAPEAEAPETEAVEVEVPETEDMPVVEEAEASSVEAEAENPEVPSDEAVEIEAEAPVVEEAEAPPVDTEAVEVEAEAPPVEASEALEAETPVEVEAEAPSVETEAVEVEVEAEAVEAEFVEIEEAPDTFEDEVPVVEGAEALPMVEDETPPMVEDETPQIEAEFVEIEETPGTFEDEAIAPELETDSPNASVDAFDEPPTDLPLENGVSDGFSTEEAPLIETVEAPVPEQLDEPVPFAVEQIDDLSPGTELMDGTGEQMDGEQMMMNNGQMDNNDSNIENATLSNTPDASQPELR